MRPNGRAASATSALPTPTLNRPWAAATACSRTVVFPSPASPATNNALPRPSSASPIRPCNAAIVPPSRNARVKGQRMRVLVAGASGAIGMPLVRLLRHAGHEVVAVHRAPEGRARLAKEGAVPVQADMLDRRGLAQALAGQWADAVISELTALSKTPLRPPAIAPTNRPPPVRPNPL